MKKCNKCGIEKELTDFPFHKNMANGQLNSCRNCLKEYALSRYKKKSENKEWLENVRKKARERYYERYKGNLSKPTKEEYFIIKRKWREKYPEKQRAHTLSDNIVSNGKNKHHWNYNKGYEKNIFFLSITQHNAVHRYMIYDQERMMYRKLNGELLDSRESSKSYYLEILKKENLYEDDNSIEC